MSFEDNQDSSNLSNSNYEIKQGYHQDPVSPLPKDLGAILSEEEIGRVKRAMMEFCSRGVVNPKEVVEMMRRRGMDVENTLLYSIMCKIERECSGVKGGISSSEFSELLDNSLVFLNSTLSSSLIGFFFDFIGSIVEGSGSLTLSCSAVLQTFNYQNN